MFGASYINIKSKYFYVKLTAWWYNYINHNLKYNNSPMIYLQGYLLFILSKTHCSTSILTHATEREDNCIGFGNSPLFL